MRVIGSDGDQLGVMATRDALKLAEEEAMDLVEISPQARPPVCRILDYGKYCYEEAKNNRKTKKKQTSSQLKEMRYRPKIDEHDIRFKTERLRGFLTEGHKVRAYVEFRGREMAHTEFGYRILERIKEQLAEVGVPESNIRMEGRHMSIIINPKRDAGKQKEPSGPSQQSQRRDTATSIADTSKGVTQSADHAVSETPSAPVQVTPVK